MKTHSRNTSIRLSMRDWGLWDAIRERLNRELGATVFSKRKTLLWCLRAAQERLNDEVEVSRMAQETPYQYRHSKMHHYGHPERMRFTDEEWSILQAVTPRLVAIFGEMADSPTFVISYALLLAAKVLELSPAKAEADFVKRITGEMLENLVLSEE